MAETIEKVRIRITSTPKFICLAQHEHHDEFLGAFVGLEFDAIPDPEDSTLYLVTVGDAERALRKVNHIDNIATVYWTGHWHRTQHLLEDPLYFPKSCCEIINEE